MDPRDGELIERWRRGEPAAFEELVRRWQPPVSRFLSRWTGQAETARDLCQEVFLRVYQASSRYRENGAFASWIYRIALNVARDAARRTRREPEPLPSEPPADVTPSGVELCEQRELTRFVQHSLAELPENQRLVLVLRHYQQLSFEEIARLTGTPATTLKSRFAAALQRLRSQLEEHGWGPEEVDA
jgi:RNA polymerase sigma-70 factor (ECF subfamily)